MQGVWSVTMEEGGPYRDAERSITVTVGIYSSKALALSAARLAIEKNTVRKSPPPFACSIPFRFRSLVRSFLPSFVRSFVRSFSSRSFVPSFSSRSFVPSFVRVFCCLDAWDASAQAAQFSWKKGGLDSKFMADSTKMIGDSGVVYKVEDPEGEYALVRLSKLARS
jgi:hypothetical protein